MEYGVGCPWHININIKIINIATSPCLVFLYSKSNLTQRSWWYSKFSSLYWKWDYCYHVFLVIQRWANMIWFDLWKLFDNSIYTNARLHLDEVFFCYYAKGFITVIFWYMFYLYWINDKNHVILKVMLENGKLTHNNICKKTDYFLPDMCGIHLWSYWYINSWPHPCPNRAQKLIQILKTSPYPLRERSVLASLCWIVIIMIKYHHV